MSTNYLPINKIKKFVKETNEEQNEIILNKLNNIMIILIVGFTAMFTFIVLQNYNWIKLLNKN